MHRELQDAVRVKFSLDKLLATFSIPVESHIVKKNKRPIQRFGHRLGIGKSAKLRHAEDEMILALRSQANKQKLLSTPFECRMWLICHFYFTSDNYYCHDRKGNVLPQIKANIPDLSNLYELPQDCLQKAGIIANDTLIDSHDLSRRLVGPETRLDIFLLRYEGHHGTEPIKRIER